MQSTFKLKINGKVVATVAASKDTSLGQFKAHIRDMGASFDESKDTLEIECLDQPETPLLMLPLDNRMEGPAIAIGVHIDNLITAYGLELVKHIVESRFKVAA